jgi:hypothetical protein
MRIQFITEGGIAHFPGLSKPVIVDSDQLPAGEAAELTRLVEAARFFDLPAVVGKPPRGAADYYQYSITIEHAGRRHTVQLTDFVEDTYLRQLLDFLRAKAKAARASQRSPGPR